MDIFAIACCLGQAWGAVRFCGAYLETGTVQKRLFFVCLVLRGRLSGLPELFAQWQNVSGWSGMSEVPLIIIACLDHLLIAGMVAGLFPAGWEKKILAASMLSAVMTLAGHFWNCLISALMLFYLHQKHHMTAFVLDPWQTQIISCSSLVAEAFVLFRLSRHPLRDFHGRSKMWYLWAALPLFMVMAVLDVADWGASRGILVRTEQMGLYYDQLFSHMMIFVLTVLCIAVAVCCLYGMDRIYLEQEKAGRYQARIAAYQMLQEQYSQSERLRHDLKNHLLALAGMLERKELEQMEVYLRRMQDFGNIRTGEDVTGSRALDAVLCQKRTLAQEKQILWECEVQVPKTCRIDAFDLCVLFGNLLDNALEACGRMPEQEKRWIRVRSGVLKKCFLMEVTNSTASDERKPSKVRAKANKERSGHGIGLLNVRDLADKYNGVMESGISDGVYMVSILIPLEWEDARL